jgi:putative ABC transport system substrate-binding protein
MSAQNAARTARIGYLTLHPPGDGEAALTDGLNNLGWTEGQNITIDRRICSGDMHCLEKSAVELAKLKLDVIVAVSTSGVQAARNATTSIPIVMAATGDPVGQGFVASLARPGGRITGTSFDAGPEITTKQVAVGTPVTGRPPHRSVHAAFPHTAPTSGHNGRYLPYAFQRL